MRWGYVVLTCLVLLLAAGCGDNYDETAVGDQTPTPEYTDP